MAERGGWSSGSEETFSSGYFDSSTYDPYAGAYGNQRGSGYDPAGDAYGGISSPRRRSRGRLVVFVLIAVTLGVTLAIGGVLAMLAAAGGGESTPRDEPPAPVVPDESGLFDISGADIQTEGEGEHVIRLVAVSDEDFRVTYRSVTGETAQDTVSESPWVIDLRAEDMSDLVGSNLIVGTVASAPVHCQMYIDDRLVAQESDLEDHGTVGCSTAAFSDYGISSPAE